MPIKNHSLTFKAVVSKMYFLYIILYTCQIVSELYNMNNNGTLVLRVDLTGDSAREFEIIKKRKGLKQNSEVARLIIREAYALLEHSPEVLTS